MGQVNALSAISLPHSPLHAAIRATICLFIYSFFLLFISVFGTLSVMVHFQTIHQQSQYINYVFLLPEDGVGVGTKKQNMDIMINLYLKVITLRKPVVYLREALTSWSYSVVGS